MLCERYCRGGKSARSLTPTGSGGERARPLIISPRMGHIAERVAFSMGCLLIAGCRLTGGRRRLAAALRVLTGWPLVDGLAAWLPGCLALALGCLAACCLLARSAGSGCTLLGSFAVFVAIKSRSSLSTIHHARC